jgi:hypothetical protein
MNHAQQDRALLPTASSHARGDRVSRNTSMCVPAAALTLGRSAPSDPAPAGDDPRDARCARVPLNKRQAFADIGKGVRHLAVPLSISISVGFESCGSPAAAMRCPPRRRARISHQISAHYGHQLSARCRTAEKAFPGRSAMRPCQRYRVEGRALCIFVAVSTDYLVPGKGFEPLRCFRTTEF